ncbi:MAG: polyribonucleotide nucleotidyltransferase [Proteobacteria bacterium]|nr:polyribonucleotide nucleotidyltransferase [Pseudomonadota bacterium]
MFTMYKKELTWGGKPLTIETGRIARQADGAALVTYGETTVLATVCFNKKPKEGLDFFPLTVTYQEKFYANGKIPGGFLKRESRPSEKETLISRLIDRPIRPMFEDGFKNETQVMCQVLSYDKENNADVVGLIGACAALAISGAPTAGTLGGCRIGLVDGEYQLNPTNDEVEGSDLDLMIAGTKEGVLMVESEAQELSEEVMLGAVVYGHKEIQKLIAAIDEITEAAGKERFVPEKVETHDELFASLKEFCGEDVVKAYSLEKKLDRKARLDELKAQSKTKLVTEDAPEVSLIIDKLFKKLEADVLRGSVLKTKTRIDGRTPTMIRPIVCQTDILPRVHGSALFTRGETQGLIVATLGNGKDEKMVDGLDDLMFDRFMLHYNFPSFSVGECGRVGPPGRREIGHGKLARRAIEPMLPSKEDFPYTIRLVSEITESNGSSSMASVCGSSMALMAAGVPIARPVSGIAMGLIKEGDDFVVLSDILGDEDHLGDMDFKVAGTEKGITALQMDIKITSITADIMKQALAQAYEGRIHILGKMAEAITETRAEMSEYAPSIHSFMINKEKIREVIGAGGKVIRQLQEDSGAEIMIDEDGKITVSGIGQETIDKACKMIKDIVTEAEVGKNYEGEVVRVVDFGAFVRVLPNVEGLVHVSEIASVRVNVVDDILKEGDKIDVTCLGIEHGKVKLSMKNVEQTNDEIVARIDNVIETGGSPRPERNDRDNNRGKFNNKRRSFNR